jgi:predicted transcriptional regulator
MGVISIRLNKDEEKILEKLSEHFHEDKSALVKKSLHELYENILDLDEIKKYETKERKGRTSFYTAEDILKS